MRLHAAKNKLFDNCLILAPDNVVLGRCAQRKFDWYINNKLADIIDSNPPTLRLRFEPSGRKGANDPLHLVGKPNICIVCGTKENLSKHHVIPHCIIKYMPEKYKRHNSHDIVPLCLDCHSQYEIKSQEKKIELAVQYNIPVLGIGTEELNKKLYVSGRARALVRHGHKMPETKKQQLLNQIADKLGFIPSRDQLIALDKSNPRKEVQVIHFGEMLLEHIEDVDVFAKMWREHFTKMMNPKFPMKGWQIDRKFEES